MGVAILVMVVLAVVAAIGLYCGIMIARVVRDQFDELLPQRMVDYSGFVDAATGRDSVSL
jgi:hypothetical protein